MLWFIKKKVLMLNEVMGTSGAENRVDGVVTVDDCASADHTLSILMGDAVGPRRDYISKHAINLSMGDLDV